MSVSTSRGALDVVQTRCVLLGLTVELEYVPVADELTRRAAFGLGAVCDRELLGVLFTLPADLPVPRWTLSARHQRLVRRAPAGAVALTRREVTRLAVPPLRVRHVSLRARPTAANLRALSVFGPFSARTLHATTGHFGADAAAEADRLGITVRSPDNAVRCKGAPFVVRRHTAATWLFLEQAAAAITGKAASSAEAYEVCLT